MEIPPWSAKQLRKLGESIRDGLTAKPGLPSYDDVMLYYNDVAAETQELIAGLDWTTLLDRRPFEVTSRPKTIDTLRQKLVRDRNTPLSNVQDIAGVRFEAEMSLDEQDAVATAISGLFGHSPERCMHDLRTQPHSGYRAVHLWLRLPVRVEVQIRTHMQSSWANMYESAADVLGRDIRYGAFPDDPSLKKFVTDLQEISVDGIRQLESARNGLLPLESSLATTRSVVAQYDPGTRDYDFHDQHAARQAIQLEELRNVVLASEKSIRGQMDSLKATFDTIRETGR
ncbi:hypothetical protein ACIPWF_14615 [Paenarthrobacter sp. NPDC089989]|uniref:hypothetical protein n=1 Tax=unclassified Paenarthrobacter TaxID=2634190 RepID=UPI0037CC78B4